MADRPLFTLTTLAFIGYATFAITQFLYEAIGGRELNREIITPFQGKYIKLVLQGNFALNGIIEQVYDDSILFTTRQKTAVIRFDRIQEICADNGGNYDRR